MDLVKSHLLYAVREEVEVMKENQRTLPPKKISAETEKQSTINMVSSKLLTVSGPSAR